MKILLVEDEHDLGHVLAEYLRLKDFEVIWTESGEEALEADPDMRYDLCLLDIMLPGMDGFELSRRIRQLNPDMPLMFLTAKILKEDRIRGLTLGADDYICKPFEVDELVLRIRNVLRRSHAVPAEKITLGSATVSFDEMTLAAGSKTFRLTVRENELLRYLWQHRNQVVEREKILTDLWGENDYFMGRSMDVFISRLRKYLRNIREAEIATIRGKGLMLRVRESSSANPRDSGTGNTTG